jgi:hypothetical protein
VVTSILSHSTFFSICWSVWYSEKPDTSVLATLHYFFDAGTLALELTPQSAYSLLESLNKLEEETGLVKSQLVPYWLVQAFTKGGARMKRKLDLTKKHALEQLKLYFGGLSK